MCCIKGSLTCADRLFWNVRHVETVEENATSVLSKILDVSMSLVQVRGSISPGTCGMKWFGSTLNSYILEKVDSAVSLVFRIIIKPTFTEMGGQLNVKTEGVYVI